MIPASLYSGLVQQSAGVVRPLQQLQMSKQSDKDNELQELGKLDELACPLLSKLRDSFTYAKARTAASTMEVYTATAKRAAF